MGLLNSIKDHFTNAEFTVAPNKKVKTVCADCKKTVGSTLAIYKGTQLADPDMTLAELNKRRTKDVRTKESGEVEIKGSRKVGEAEKLFDQMFGLTVQIKDPKGKECVDNKLTIGQAARGEIK